MTAPDIRESTRVPLVEAIARIGDMGLAVERDNEGHGDTWTIYDPHGDDRWFGKTLPEALEAVLPNVVVERDPTAELVEALEAARRAIGEHSIPGDCYATGPMTGDTLRDLVECPACTAIPLIDAALAAYEASRK